MNKKLHTDPNAVLFTKDMKKTHTIFIPTMLPIHFNMIGGILENYGYKIRLLSNTGKAVVDEGLKYVHNDTCYPATLVIGQLIDALRHSDIPVDRVALLITQTGGGCRASNYIYLLRKALQKCGYGQVPVISANFFKSELTGDFALPKTMLLSALYSVFCADLIMSLSNQCRPYEKEEGSTDRMVCRCTAYCTDYFKRHALIRWKKVEELQKRILADFDSIPRNPGKKIKVGIVGEIYVKYSPLGNNNLEDFLLSEGCEVVCPGLMDFMLYCFYNSLMDTQMYGLGRAKYPFMKKVCTHLFARKRASIRLIRENSRFVPPSPFEEIIEVSKDYISPGVKMGEGWLLTAEMVELIRLQNVKNIVCTQPFGCLPNHIVGKGMIRAIKERNPDANIVAIDYDAGISQVNQQNRIKLMLDSARDTLPVG